MKKTWVSTLSKLTKDTKTGGLRATGDQTQDKAAKIVRKELPALIEELVTEEATIMPRLYS